MSEKICKNCSSMNPSYAVWCGTCSESLKADNPPLVRPPVEPSVHVPSRLEKLLQQIKIKHLLIAGAALVLLLVAIPIYRFIRDRQTQVLRPGGDAVAVQSVAIFPFVYQDNPGLGKGMADTVISKLQKLNQIRVQPSSSVLRYNGNEDTLGQDAEKKFGVDAYVLGNIQKSHDRIRVNAEFYKVGSTQPYRVEQIDENSTDDFRAQDLTAERIATVLSLNTSSEEAKKILTQRDTENKDAFALYTLGRYNWSFRKEPQFREAIKLFQQAIDKDPRYARAYSGVADCYALLGFFTYVPPREGFGESKRFARTALDIDPNIAEAHASLGYSAGFYDYDWAEAERQYKKSIELQESYATAHHWYALMLARQGRAQEAEKEIKRALELDPRSSIINRSAGLLLYYQRNYDKAIEQYDRTLANDPKFTNGHLLKALALALKGKHQEAMNSLEDARKSAAPDGDRNIEPELGVLYALAGDRERAQQVVYSLTAKTHKGYVSPYEIAQIYASMDSTRDSTNRTFYWLNQALQENSDKLALLKVDPLFYKFQNDQRYKDLLRSVRLS